MATKKRKKRSWLKTLLFFILVPLVVWFTAFLVWFYGKDLAGLFTKDQDNSRAVPKATREIAPREKSGTSAPKRSQEKLLEEDRQKLEEILKRRS